jgi:glycosyltransferase involved in cell wall biosynthesis
VVKLLHCVHSIKPESGGPVEFIRQMAEQQKKLGYTIEVLSTDRSDSNYIQEFPAPVHALGSGSAYGYSPQYLEWLENHVGEFDLAIVNGLWQYPSFAVRHACRRSQKPYVVFPHGMLDPWFNTAFPIKHLKKIIYWFFIEHQVLGEARAVLFTSEDERLRARQSFSPYEVKKEFVVPFGVSGPRGNESTQRQLFLDAFPKLANKRILLFLGRIHKKKGIDLLLSAFSAIADAHEKLALVITGPCATDYAEHLKNRFFVEHPALVDRVIWTGMLRDQLKAGAFYSAEAMILPSHQENFAFSIAEALAHRRPALISNRVNIWREVETAGAGFVEADDLEGTKNLLRRWLALSDDQRLKMQVAAENCFRKQFEISASLNQLIPILKRCAGTA